MQRGIHTTSDYNWVLAEQCLVSRNVVMDVIVFKNTHADLATIVISSSHGFARPARFYICFEMKSHPNNDILILNCYKSYHRKWKWGGIIGCDVVTKNQFCER